LVSASALALESVSASVLVVFVSKLGFALASALALLCVASPTSTTCFGSAWFRMILPGYMSALQIADVFGCLVTRLLYRLQLCFGSGFALIYMHLFGLLRIETSSSTESALWDAPLYVCFSVFVYYIFDKLPMFTVAAL
ncbi:hypothetical protein Tco_1432183, partial [Tanacetum coccineum]